jgi:hypothetical protein
MNWILQQSKKDPKFELYLNLRRGDKFMTEGSKIASFLVTPIQRIPRYKLLLQEMIKKSPTDHVDYKDLENALNIISEVADYLNLQVQNRNKFTKMKIISSKLISMNEDIIVKNRLFLEHERVLQITSLASSSCVLFLFNDVLIHCLERVRVGLGQYQPITTQEEKSLNEILSLNDQNPIHFELKYSFPIKEIEISNVDDIGIILKSQGKEIQYSFESKEKKEFWIKEIQNCQRNLI